MRRYASLLARPQIRWMFAGALLGRIPYAMESIGTVVFLKSANGSYAVAGGVAGALAAGIAVGSVVQGRRADRGGSTALVPLGLIHLLLMGGLVSGGLGDWGTAPLALVGFAVGASIPPTSSVLRTLYPAVFSRDPSGLQAAFGLDSALTDMTYIAGPALVSIAVLLASSSAALLFAAGAALASVLVLVLRGPAAHAAPPPENSAPKSALRAPGIRTLSLATLPVGAAFGVWEVAFPAFGESQGELALGGLLISLVGVGSAVSALAYGAASHRSPATVFVRRSLLLAPVFAAPALGSSVAAVALLTVPLGLLVGPWAASRNQLTASHSLPGTEVEAYAWALTALLAGTALGTALAGPLVEHAGWRIAMIASGGIAALTGLLVLRHEAQVAPPPARTPVL
jgi:MFS family permease